MIELGDWLFTVCWVDFIVLFVVSRLLRCKVGGAMFLFFLSSWWLVLRVETSPLLFPRTESRAC